MAGLLLKTTKKARKNFLQGKVPEKHKNYLAEDLVSINLIVAEQEIEKTNFQGLGV